MKGVYFNGRRYIRPQAVSKIDDTGMYGRGLGGGNTIAIIGEATGGDPKKVLWFTDPSYAKSIFRSGNLLTAIQRAYDPSTEGGAYLMGAIRVNPAVQSSLNLKDTSGHSVITLTSVDYGAWNNQIKARVEYSTNYIPGTTDYGKKVTITYGTSEDQGDNIYKKSLYVALSDPKALTGSMAVDTISTHLMSFAVTANYQKAYYAMFGTTAAAVTTSATKLTDSRLALVVSAYVGAVVACNGRTLTVTANDATSFTGAAWSGTSGTANVAVTTSATKLTDSRLTLETNSYVGATVTCDAKTLLVTANDATSFTGASWAGGTPASGLAWAVAGGTPGAFAGGTPGNMAWSASVAWSGTAPVYSTALSLVTAATGHYIYVGSDIPFNKLTYDCKVANAATAAVLAMQYWNGSAWTALTIASDTTIVAGATLAQDGTIAFTSGDYVYPSGWAKTRDLLAAPVVTKEELYWVRLYVTGASCTADTPCGDTVGATIVRNRSADLATYTTIQQLSDYVDSLDGFESGVLTASPSVDLSTNLDDSTTNFFTLANSIVSPTQYVPADLRVLLVAALDNFSVGDYISISQVGGGVEEIRRITAKSAATGAGSITMDSALSTTYAVGSIVREAGLVNSNLQAVIDWLNNGNTAYVTAAAFTGIADRATLANVPDTYMAGGTDGVTSQTDWDDCLDLLKTEDTPLVTCVTPDPSVWASLSTHVTYMSTVGKKERRGFCGGFDPDNYTNGLGKWTNSSEIVASIDSMLTYAEELNSDRMYYVGPGFIAYDENGVKTTYNGCFSAALAAGLASALDVAEPLTHKSIKVLGLEYNLKWADLDQLLEGGVFPLEYDPGFGYRVCQSISTWLVNDNYYRRELSTGRVGDLVARNVRDRLEQDFVGKKGTATTLLSIKNATISILAAAYRDGYLAGDASNPPYKNIQCRLDGDICYVDFECSPVIPINYIPITIHLTVFTATLVA